MRTVSKSATFLATESVNSAPFKRGETEVQIFWQGIAQNSSSILRCTFLARRRAKLIANFSATMVTSLPSFSLSLSLSLSLCISLSLSLSLCISLSLSLSLSPNVPHAQYRKRFRASYNIAQENSPKKKVQKHNLLVPCSRCSIGSRQTCAVSKVVKSDIEVLTTSPSDHMKGWHEKFAAFLTK